MANDELGKLECIGVAFRDNGEVVFQVSSDKMLTVNEHHIDALDELFYAHNFNVEQKRLEQACNSENGVI